MKRVILILFALLLPVATNASDLLLSWDDALLRSDGQLITGAKLYHIRWSVDNVPQPEVQVAGSLTNHKIVNVGAGTHTVQIATSEDGLMGEWSDPVSVVLGDLPLAAPAKQTLTISFTCEGCGLEVK